jgi:hypothetical protein
MGILISLLNQKQFYKYLIPIFEPKYPGKAIFSALALAMF